MSQFLLNILSQINKFHFPQTCFFRKRAFLCSQYLFVKINLLKTCDSLLIPMFFSYLISPNLFQSPIQMALIINFRVISKREIMFVLSRSEYVLNNMLYWRIHGGRPSPPPPWEAHLLKNVYFLYNIFNISEMLNHNFDIPKIFNFNLRKM